MTGSPRLFEFCVAEATRLLEANEEFSPFGALLDAGGTPHGIECEDPEALVGEMLDLMSNGVVRAIALVRMNEDTGTIDVHCQWGSEARLGRWSYRRRRQGLFRQRQIVDLFEEGLDRAELLMPAAT